ncbi:unnamed protein product, partial [Rotaria sp. Silwood2]
SCKKAGVSSNQERLNVNDTLISATCFDVELINTVWS